MSHKLCERIFIQCEICKYFICFGDCFADYVLSHTRTAVESGYDNKVYALYDDFNDPQDCETNAEVESPYNTYLNEGLPIGPILNPGEEAIKAVLSPKHTDYLFFAADIYNKVDGKVHYSKTYEEHLQICEELGLNL